MGTYTCQCGARYKLPAGAGGRQARCKRCGEAFIIPHEAAEPETIPIAGDDVEAAAAEAARSPAVRTSARVRSDDELVNIGRSSLTGNQPARGFWQDVGWTFLLFTDPGNLITLLIVAFLYGLIPIVRMAGCIGAVCLIIIYGWLFAFWFNVITEAASGEETLPRIGMIDGVVDDILLPLLKFFGATVLASTPVILLTLAVHKFGWRVSLDPPGPVMLTAMMASAFILPMILLVVSLGGFASLGRLDLIAMTIARTFVPYFAVCVLFCATAAMHTHADQIIGAVIKGGGGKAALYVLAAVLQAYFGIVSMRIVGLYYHHYKQRFEWSWS